MKSFLEEYGFAILAAIVVILLIAMCTPVGNLIKSQVLNVVNKFANTADKKLDASSSEGFTATLIQNTGAKTVKLIVGSDSTDDTYEYTVHYVEGGVELESDVVGGTLENGEWTIASDAGAFTAKDKKTKTAAIVPDDNSQIYIEVVNEGTQEHFYSNTITYRTNED